MRFRSLTLERFGHFTGGVLDLDAPTGLHIVCGPNEAGKTTVLAGICDLLFGIETRSAYNFRHDYSEMRLGAEIEAKDGRRLAFRRRKGRSNTVLDRDDGAMAESILAPFLGANVDRDLFQGLFGLDHARLRKGGEDLLQARGELGRMLFEAGSGIAGLGRVSRELDERANALFSVRRAASKPFYQALDRLSDARRRQRESAVGSDEWRQLTQRLKDADGRLAANREQLSAIEVARAAAERKRRVLPLVTSLREVEARLVPLEGTVDLPEGAAAERADALARLEAAQLSHARCTETAGRLSADLAAVTVPGRLLAEARRAETLYEQRAVIREQILDLPKREVELRQLHDQVADLLRRLGSSLPRERAREAVPPQPVLGEVRALLREEGIMRERMTAAREGLAKAEAESRRLTLRIGDLTRTAEPAGLLEALAEVKAHGDVEGALADQRAEAAGLDERCGRQVAALPLWDRDAQALASVPVPDEASVRRLEAAFADLAARDAGIATRHEALTEDRHRAVREIDALMAERDVPDAAAVAAARRRRDEGWRLVRAHLVDGAGPAADAVSRFAGDAPLAAAFEAAMRDADALADRKEAEAQRVARYRELVARREEADQRIARIGVERAAAADERRRLDEEWRSHWLGAGVQPLSPREMAAWLARRGELLRDYEALRTCERRIERLAGEVETARGRIAGALRALGGEAGEGEALAVLVRRADELAGRLAAAAAERRSLEQRLVEQQADLDRARRQVERDAAAELAWTERWNRAVRALGCPSDAGPAAVEAMLAVIEELDRKLRQAADVGHEVVRMRQNVDAFGEAVAALWRDVATEPAPAVPELVSEGALPPHAPAAPFDDETPEDPIEAAGRLFSRLTSARKDADRRADLTRHLNEAMSEADAAHRQMAVARAALDRLLQLAGVADEDMLAEAIGRSETRRGLIRRHAEIERDLTAAGDGHARDELIAEVEDADPDRLLAELARLRAEQETLYAEGTEIGAQREALRRQLDELERGRGAGDAAQDAQQALTDLREVTADYARAKAASILLRRAVDRYREEQQGPLLGRASALFRTLTLEAFAGLRVDYDGHDQPVLKGERATGGVVPVDGMSDGTRDQLYLALRLAAVERYVGDAEPLPFVADDLLVNFDDDRAAAAFSVLEELGRSTQVLFFTHHSHLCSVARSRLGNGAFTLHNLPRP